RSSDLSPRLTKPKFHYLPAYVAIAVSAEHSKHCTITLSLRIFMSVPAHHIFNTLRCARSSVTATLCSASSVYFRCNLRLVSNWLVPFCCERRINTISDLSALLLISTPLWIAFRQAVHRQIR